MNSRDMNSNETWSNNYDDMKEDSYNGYGGQNKRPYNSKKHNNGRMNEKNNMSERSLDYAEMNKSKNKFSYNVIILLIFAV